MQLSFSVFFALSGSVRIKAVRFKHLGEIFISLFRGTRAKKGWEPLLYGIRS